MEVDAVQGDMCKIDKVLGLEGIIYRYNEYQHSLKLFNTKDTQINKKSVGLFKKKIQETTRINELGLMQLRNKEKEIENITLFVYGRENIKRGEELAKNLSSALGQKVIVDLDLREQKKRYVSPDYI